MFINYKALYSNKIYEIENINYVSKTVVLSSNEKSLSAKFEDIVFLISSNLQDKNEKEIFEGDWIKDNKGIFWSVFYDLEYAALACKRVPGNSVEWLNKHAGTSEIVGNIFEDPNIYRETTE